MRRGFVANRQRALKLVRRILFIVGGGGISAVALWIFAFGAYNMPMTSSGVDGLMSGPMPFGVVIGCVAGAASVYFLERRSKNK
jgi:hypothetical protein